MTCFKSRENEEWFNVLWFDIKSKLHFLNWKNYFYLVMDAVFIEMYFYLIQIAKQANYRNKKYAGCMELIPNNTV